MSRRKELADALRMYRRRANMTTTRLAKMMSTSQARISRWENGKTLPSPYMAGAWVATCGGSDQEQREVKELAMQADTEGRHPARKFTPEDVVAMKAYVHGMIWMTLQQGVAMKVLPLETEIIQCGVEAPTHVEVQLPSGIRLKVTVENIETENKI